MRISTKNARKLRLAMRDAREVEEAWLKTRVRGSMPPQEAANWSMFAVLLTRANSDEYAIAPKWLHKAYYHYREYFDRKFRMSSGGKR